MNKLRRIISILLSLAMTSGGAVFADSRQDMLAPNAHIQAGTFQAGYAQAFNLASANLATSDFGKEMRQLAETSAALKNNTRFREFSEKFELALNKFLEGEGYAVLFEVAVSAAKSPKIYANKDVMELTGTAIKFWNESARLLGDLDPEVLTLSEPQVQNRMMYIFLSLKAEVLYTLTEKNPNLSDRQKLSNYKVIKESQEQAFSLPQADKNFSGFFRLATSCAKLATDAKLSLEQKLALSEESLAYFDLAREQILGLADNSTNRGLINDMYFTYFTVLYFAGDVCKEMQKYDQALEFYSRVEPLFEKLAKLDYSASALKGFYLDYYRLAWKLGDYFYGRISLENPENNDRTMQLYAQARKLAEKFRSLLSPQELMTDLGSDALVCVAEINLNLAKLAMKNQERGAVNKYLLDCAAALRSLRQINTEDLATNFVIAKINVTFLQHVIEETISRFGGKSIGPEQIAAISEMLDKDFFARFLGKMNRGEYPEMIAAFSNGRKNTAEVLLDRAFFCDSAANAEICRLLEKVVRFKFRDREFDKKYGYLTRITLASAQIKAGNYAQARLAVIDAANYRDDFSASTAFVETMLPLLAEDKAKGRDFVLGLFLSRIDTSLRANILAHQAELTPQSKALLREIFADQNNQRLAKNNKDLLPVLGVKLAEPALGKANNSGKPAYPDDVLLIRTPEVLIQNVNNAVGALKQKLAEKPKRTKGHKPSKAKVGLDMSSQQIGQLRNALTQMREAYEQRGSTVLLNYLMNLPQKDKEIFRNKYVLRTLLQVVSQLEQEKVLEILKHYLDVLLEDTDIAREISDRLQELDKYFQDIKTFEGAASALEGKISRMDIGAMSFAQANGRISSARAEGEALLKKFSGIGERRLGREALAMRQEKIQALITQAQRKAQAVLEKKRSDFIQACVLWEQEFEWTRTKLNDPKRSGAGLVQELMLWQNLQKFPQADADISGLEQIKNESARIRALWEQAQPEVRSLIEKNSLIAKNKIKFSFSPDLKTLRFENIEILMGVNRDTVVAQMFEVLRVFVQLNPDADLNSAVVGTEHPNSEGIFLPLLARAKAMIFEEREAIAFSREADEFMKQYEQKMDKLLNSGMSKIALIKAVDELLSGEFDDPEFAGKYDPDLKDNAGITEKALDDFSARSHALYAQQDEISVVCRGMFQLEVEGDYRYLHFKPLKDAIDIKKVKKELSALWQEALRHNLEIEMQVSAELESQEWVEAIADIWAQAYDQVKAEKARQAVAEEQIETTRRIIGTDAAAISQSI